MTVGSDADAADRTDDLRATLPGALGALRQFVERLRVPTGDVDDVVQEALARAWRSRRSFDPAAGSLDAWLRTTAFRTWLDLRARRPRARAGGLGDSAPGPELVDPRQAAPGLRAELDELLARLAPLERRALLLFHRDGGSRNGGPRRTDDEL
ncbi:MAG: sigma-70 family RNA polymerase sigma factor [Planctomycetes bacterium]|nr:sigma-70 family RNA polymerase sigma factor [Planctomycetota bacterium]